MNVFSTVWFVRNNIEIIWQIAKHSRLNLEANFALDSSLSNANQVSNHPKKTNFVVKLKWLHTIFSNLIRDRCASGLISSILLNGNASILLDQCFPQFILNIILLNLYWYLFFFLDGSQGVCGGACSEGWEPVCMHFQRITPKYLVDL